MAQVQTNVDGPGGQAPKVDYIDHMNGDPYDNEPPGGSAIQMPTRVNQDDLQGPHDPGGAARPNQSNTQREAERRKPTPPLEQRSLFRSNQARSQGFKQDRPEGLCKHISNVVCRSYPLWSNRLFRRQLSNVVTSQSDVLVRAVIHRIENHRNNARAININWHGLTKLRTQFLKQVNQPLCFLCGKKKSCILRVVRAGCNEGMQFAMPGKDGVAEEEGVSDGAFGRIRAVCKRSVRVAMKSCNSCRFAEVKVETEGSGSAEVAEKVF